MADRNKAMVFLFLCCVGIMVIPFIASCGKNGTAPAGSNIQMQVINLSPDLQPVNLYVSYIKQNTVPFSYPSPSGYFTLKNIDTPVQIRSYNTNVSTTNFISLNTPLKNNYKYTLFVTGLRADSSITSIFTIDTAATPAVGRGKIRFVNASPRSGAFDITVNGTMAFTNQGYKKVSNFIEVPPGNYDFKILPTGSGKVLADMPGTVILDGKVYTLYCRGIVGGADSVAFAGGILNNR
ncbi:DUF4397 domain-containing protein [Mucilaginibacter sp.]|uniref:DUF4397 domain-containing protein n=1 Tax=Mucilaginibacter sp. TaxID=1882438 RepID=UPI00261C2000|nr:DUF4397 domain-containing protein [Mucilaginibacter sp.]MDB4924965.1 hypothetical protein [Mucilaginibacter sp.]